MVLWLTRFIEQVVLPNAVVSGTGIQNPVMAGDHFQSVG